MNILELKDINKVYGKNEYTTIALENVNLVIEKGDMVAIMGPSGSGKTTLLNILGLIDDPTSGEYLINGINSTKLNEKDRAKLRNSGIGFVFQNFNLISNQSLVYNVSIPLLYSNNKKGYKERSSTMLKSLGLDGHITKSVTELSGGQKQRVAIARALVNNPDIILADEPTGALDKSTGLMVMNLLRNINESGKTIIIITHDQEVANCCNRIIRIVDGRLQ